MQVISLQSDLMRRRYSDAVDGCSTAAGHVLWMLINLREHGETTVTLPRLLAYVHGTGRDDWTESQLRTYLDELRRNDCINWVDVADPGRARGSLSTAESIR